MKKIQYNSPVILTYVLLCCGVLLLDGLTGGRSTSLCFCVYRSSPGDALTYVRLLGHVLGHADWQHFFNNVLYLLIVGPSVEEKYGSKNTLIAMLVTAFVSGAAHMVLAPNAALLGASGAVSVAFTSTVAVSVVSPFSNAPPLALYVTVYSALASEELLSLPLTLPESSPPHAAKPSELANTPKQSNKFMKNFRAMTKSV